MINFNTNSVWNLKPIGTGEVRGEISGMLVPGEKVAAAFKTIRDQLIFTNKRVIAVDVQGLTGARKSYASMPYSKVQFFTIQTPGLIEVVPDSELVLTFSNGFTAAFEFKGGTDIGELGRMIAEFVLDGHGM